MAGERRFTQIPPRSTGDRMAMVHSLEIPYDQKQGNTWKIGESYTITGGGGSTIHMHVHGVVDFGDNTGKIQVHLDEVQNYNLLSPIDNQEIREGGETGTLTAYVDTSGSNEIRAIYYPAQNIVGYDNPSYGWNIDRFGSGNIRFGEGPPEINAFGGLRTSQQQLFAQYDFTRSDLADEFVTSNENGGSATWEQGSGRINLGVTGVAADRATYTSNMFHPYIPGSGILFIMGMHCSTPLVGEVRNWGAFDATDGFFFQIAGTDAAPANKGVAGGGAAVTPAAGSALRIVHRWTFNGVQGEHHVLQNEWNKDTLLGTGGVNNPSGMNINVTKINTFWIDYQFLGGGRTRWGVFYNGERIVCHEMFHGNAIVGNMTANSNPIGNPNRPVCWAIANAPWAGGAPTAQTGSIYAHGAGVYLEAGADPLTESDLRTYFTTKTVPKNRVDDFNEGSTQYMFTLSPAQYLRGTSKTGNILNADPYENHSLYAPQQLIVDAYKSESGVDSSNTIPAMEVRMFQKCILRGENYQNLDFTYVQVDGDADHLAHGPEFGRFTFRGDHEFDFTKFFKTIQNGAVKNLSDQPFARTAQGLTNVEGQSDPYVTGVNKAAFTVNLHPIWKNSRHFFNDKQQVVVRNLTGNLADLNSATTTDWRYLSLIDGDESLIYSSPDLIDSDRKPRIVSYTGLDITLSSIWGDKTLDTGNKSYTGPYVNIVGLGHARVLAYDSTGVGTGNITLAGRSSTNLDTSAGTGNVLSVYDSAGGYRNSLTANGTGTQGAITLQSSTYPLDYATSLNALASSSSDTVSSSPILDINGDAVGVTDVGEFYGPPPPRAAWTFMIRTLENTNYDIKSRWSMTWKERIQ